MATQTDELRELLKQRGLIRAHEVETAGFPTALLYRLRDRGEIEQVGPGLFRHPDSDLTEYQSYAEVAKLVPEGVLCLLSALAFHGIGTQNPRDVWIAIARGQHRPTSPPVPLQAVWMSGPAMHEGVETHRVQSVDVRVFSPAKTVADLFKFRNKVGVDVAIEALQRGWEDRRFTAAELEHFGEICRVKRVMKPYLQAVL